MAGTVKAVAWATVAVVGGVVAYQIVRGGKSLGAAVAGAVGSIGELASGAVATVANAAGAAVNAVNPASETNVFYRSANAATAAVTGNKANKVADLFLPDPMKVLDQWDSLRNKVLRGSYTLADEAAIADLPKQVTQGFDLETAQFRATKGYY